MFGRSFKKKKIKNNLTLVLNIRSSSVGVAVIKTFKKKDRKPVILDSYRKNIFFTEELDATDFVERTHLALQKSLEKVLEGGNFSGTITKVEVFYGSPWYKIYLNDIKKKHKAKKVFDDKYLSDLLKDYNKKNLSVDEKVIEKRLIHSKINGYKVKQPIGKKFTDVELRFFESVLHKDSVRDVVRLVRKYIPVEDFRHHSHPFAIKNVLENEFESVNNYTIFEMSGEMTEISIIRDDTFQKVITAPYGTHFFARGLSKECRLNLDVAYDKLNMITSGEVSEYCDNESIKSARELKKKWGSLVAAAVKESKSRSLPVTVFVVVEDSIKSIVEDILSDVEIYSGVLRFGRKPKLTFVNSDEIKDLCRYREDVEKDPLISLASNFVSKNR